VTSLVDAIRMFSRKIAPERGEALVRLAGATIRAVSVQNNAVADAAVREQFLAAYDATRSR
jgi:hypothetical protein